MALRLVSRPRAHCAVQTGVCGPPALLEQHCRAVSLRGKGAGATFMGSSRSGPVFLRGCLLHPGACPLHPGVCLLCPGRCLLHPRVCLLCTVQCVWMGAWVAAGQNQPPWAAYTTKQHRVFVFLQGWCFSFLGACAEPSKHILTLQVSALDSEMASNQPRSIPPFAMQALSPYTNTNRPCSLNKMDSFLWLGAHRRSGPTVLHRDTQAWHPLVEKLAMAAFCGTVR